MSESSNKQDADELSWDSNNEQQLRELFRRTTPKVPPVDMRTLLASATLRRQSLRRSWRNWGLMGMAAAVLLTVGVAGGWWAGRSAAATEAARIESALAAMRSQITQDFTNTLLVTQETADHALQDELKRVALFLRNDYRSLLAGLENRLDNLTARVNVTEEQELRNSMAEAHLEKTEE